MKATVKYNNSIYSNHHFVYSLKDKTWLENQRHAGKVLTETLLTVKKLLIPGVTTKEINDCGEDFINSNDGCTPTFKGYKGYPASLCISVNKELVHGIPKETCILQDGDVVKIDAGVTYKGAIADMAATFIVGTVKNIKVAMLVDACKQSLQKTIAGIKVNSSTLGDVGYVIKKEAIKINASVISELGGHGLEIDDLHAYPYVFNIGERGDGPTIRPGMTLAIEPMMVYGNSRITYGSDNWTVSTETVGVHFEHTIFVHEDNVEIITGEVC